VPGVDRLIVGTSGSPGSLHALRYGESMARAHGAVLIPVLAWDTPGSDYAVRVQPSGQLRQEWQILACRRLRGRADHSVGRGSRRSAGGAACRARPGGLGADESCLPPGDVLVVGTGRRGALARMAPSRSTATACPMPGAVVSGPGAIWRFPCSAGQVHGAAVSRSPGACCLRTPGEGEWVRTPAVDRYLLPGAAGRGTATA
jgi:hypothetical protein